MWQALAVLGWGISTAVVFLLLIAVPSEFVLNAPIHCESYALARRGWGCAVLGDAWSSPVLFWACALVSLASAIGFLWSNGGPAWAAVLLQLAFWGISAGSVRLVYFLQGHVNSMHALLTAVGLALSVAPFLVANWYVRRHKHEG